MFDSSGEAVAVIGILIAPIIVFLAIRGSIKLKEMEAVNKRIESINSQSFESLVEELRADNANLKLELSEIKEVLSSIDKMMKDIE